MKWRLAVVTVFSLVACSDSSTGPKYVPSNPQSKAILDGRHGGNPHFFWLNPQSTLDPFDKSFTGEVNQNLSPVVRICRWNGTACDGPDVAVLSRTDPTALMDQKFWYEGVWQAWQARPLLHETFRARVLLGDLEIGVRDIKFVTKQEFSGISLGNIDFAPVVWEQSLFGGNKPSGRYRFKFRIEDGVLREALGLDGECTDCTEGSVPVNSTETVVIETPNDDAAAVFEPGSVPQTINVLVEKLDVPCLPTDAQQYPACYRFVAEPDVEFTIPATVEVCVEEVDDFAEGQIQLYKVKERRVEGEWVPSGPVEPLQNVPDRFVNCGEPEVIGAIARKHPRLARGLRAITKPLARAFGPRAAFADDEGRGGRASEFSRIGWTRAVNVTKGSGDNQTGAPGGALDPVQVRLTAVHFDEQLESAPSAAVVPLRYQLVGPDEVAGPLTNTVSNLDGVATIPVALGDATGTYRLVVTAPGTNMADRNPETGELTPRAVPQVTFTFTAAAPIGFAIEPAEILGVGNCFPFGGNTGSQFVGFIYRNIPAFTMRAGDQIAFDLGALNNEEARRNIFFAVANRNPSAAVLNATDGLAASQDVRALSWVQVVSDAQVPLNPHGNTTLGDFELVYTAQAGFSFPGGGFIIGFRDAAHSSFSDPGCEQVLAYTSSADASGQFYARFFQQPDLSLGTLDPANAGTTATWIGGVRITAGSGPIGRPIVRIGATASRPAGASTTIQNDNSANRDGTPASSSKARATGQKR